ncbi:dUTP diphosphatase [Demetria terragena]|uniref:dUTP diphosphatase n=1 Tax=Demetria terragena TaxID=63959 RepID=UPI000375A9D1|nr:dUTP diphosphatase [Demetria terragena]
MLRVPVHRLDEGLPLPRYAREGDAGLDLYAREGVTLAPGERALVDTGLAIALPAGYAGFVHPRSGLAARHGVTTLNSPGTVDSGYRGEIKVNVINCDPRDTFTVSRGDRIAQLVVQRVENVDLVDVAALPDSERGASGHGASGGFGSSVTDPSSASTTASRD